MKRDVIVDETLGPFPTPPELPAAVPVPVDILKNYVGTWRNEKSRNATV